MPRLLKNDPCPKHRRNTGMRTPRTDCPQCAKYYRFMRSSGVKEKRQHTEKWLKERAKRNKKGV